MLDRIAELPFWQAFVALFVIVMARSNATYWIGRGAMTAYLKRKHADALAPSETAPDATPARRRAEALIHRLGPVAVALSYLTIGIQTAVHLAAGSLRMPLRFYIPASIIGSAAWATLYATIGMAVVLAWISARAGSWWGLAALIALPLIGVATWLMYRRRPGDLADDDEL